jgi:mannosyltransferase OCH1-like enzyme
MHVRHIFKPLLIFTIVLGFTIWSCQDHHPISHVRDLIQCVRTYIKFPKLDLDLINYPTNTPSALTDCQPSPIHFAPKIMHQILLNEHHFHDGDGPNRFQKYESARKSCMSLHPDWTYLLWTENNATDWVREHYPEKKYPFDDTPEVYQPYIRYRQTIQRTNILRYLLLHHYGGVYLDMDITCLVNLDPLLEVPFLTPAAHPAGINNAFILARPGHPFLTKLIEQVPKHNLTWLGLPYVENMLSTGCMFISNVWVKYMGTKSDKCEDKVYILADENDNAATHMLRGNITTPLFHHGGESSWHGNDARLMFWMDKHWKLVLVGFFVGIPIFILLSVALLILLLRMKPCWSHPLRRCRHADDVEKMSIEPPRDGLGEPHGCVAGAPSPDRRPATVIGIVAPPSSGGNTAAPVPKRRASDAPSIADSVVSDNTIQREDFARGVSRFWKETGWTQH